MQVLRPAELYSWFERSVTPAWGLFGGAHGAKPDVVINPGRSDERHYLKANAVALAPGDIVELKTGGGGGFGPPWERDPEQVRNDVLDGYVSTAAAESAYGVVIVAHGQIEEPRTRERRAQMLADSRDETCIDRAPFSR